MQKILNLLCICILTGCAHVARSDAVNIDALTLKNNAELFYEREVVVSGFYNREWLLAEENVDCKKHGQTDRQIYVNLSRRDFEKPAKLQYRWVRLRGYFEPSRDIDVGGRDFTLIISGNEMIGILSKVKIIEIDNRRRCKVPEK